LSFSTDGRSSSFFYLFPGETNPFPEHRDQRVILDPDITNSVLVSRYRVQIPTHSGQAFRRDAGRDSDLMPATIPN
jgi:hypothetical protein